jgi:hypothetical protein
MRVYIIAENRSEGKSAARIQRVCRRSLAGGNLPECLPFFA